MPLYNFKKETKLYIVTSDGLLRYQLEIYPDLSCSQTFNETNVPVKTLHSQYNMFENAVITRANPANFNFTVPIQRQAELDIVLQLLRDYSSSGATLNTSDLYVQSNTEVYKLEKAVFESGVFQIQKDSPLGLQISGTAKKLSRFTGVIPGVLQARAALPAFSYLNVMNVEIGGVVQPSITSVSIELQNKVEWVDYDTLHNSLNVSSASDTMYPEAFVVQSRVLSGTIQQYVTDETAAAVNTWSTGTSITVQAGNNTTQWGLQVIIPSAVFTNRLEVQDLFIQSYDFRMVTPNPNMAQVIRKRSV